MAGRGGGERAGLGRSRLLKVCGQTPNRACDPRNREWIEAQNIPAPGTKWKPGIGRAPAVGRGPVRTSAKRRVLLINSPSQQR